MADGGAWESAWLDYDSDGAELAWSETLGHPPPDVLPLFPALLLREALVRLSPDDRLLALRQKIVAVAALPGMTFYATVTEAARREAQRLGLRVVARIDGDDFRRALRRYFGPALLDAAVNELRRHHPQYSAARRFGRGQILWLYLIGCCLVASLIALTPEVRLLVVSVGAGLFFTLTVAIRILALAGDRPPTPRSAELPASALPVYTVLVPLFRETEVLSQLLGGLMALDYPQGKLDIKLILEDNDMAMQRAVYALPLPEHFDIIIVPAGVPQTKPRALTYALQLSRGSLVTIYDSEDIPERQQLRRAAARFANADPELACLQASLTFYNPNENWLTRQFTAEYAALFEMILPELAVCGLPLPLGGTSNHFRMEALRHAGGWDPFNVTEDADLGCRLVRLGYRTETLASRTYEEAVVKLAPWMKQRRRWLKGFLHTWLVHMRRPRRLLRDMGLSCFLTFQCMSLGIFGTALLHPFLAAAGFWYFLSGAARHDSVSASHAVVVGLAGALLLTGYGAGIACAQRGLRRLGHFGWWFTLASMPFYWALMMPAAWLALWDFAVRPHHWHKTPHGLSRLLRRTAQKPRQTRGINRASAP